MNLEGVHDDHLSPLPTRRRLIGAVTGLVGLFAVAVGLSSPLFALSLADAGVGPALIGANAAMAPAGVLVAAFFAPRVAERLGAAPLALACALTGAAVYLLMGLWRSPWPWFPARFLLGAAIGGFYVVNKAWVNQLAPASHRGRVIGLYTTVLAGAFALAAVGAQAWTAFLIGAGALLGTAGAVCLLDRHLPAFTARERGSVTQFLPLAPVLLAAVAMFGLFDQATLSLLPAYGLSHGLSVAVSAAALGVLNVGNVVLQVPIGWLADRLPRRHVLAGCAAATVAGCAALPVAVTTPWLLWPLLFVWGAAAYGVTTVAAAELGDRFSGATLLAGSAALTMMGGLGGVAGAPLAGAAMSLFGPEGLPLTIAGGFAALTLLAGACGLTRRQSVTPPSPPDLKLAAGSATPPAPT